MSASLSLNAVVATYFPSTVQFSTSRAYITLIRNLWKTALKRDEQELLTWDWDAPDDAKAWHGRWTRIFYDPLEDWVMNGDLKDTTKRNYMNAIHVTLQGDDAAQKLTKQCIIQLNTLINDQEGSQQKDAKELEFGLTHDQLCQVVRALHGVVSGLTAFVERRPMTEEEAFGDVNGWNKVFHWLALACYVLTPPIRGEWGNMKIVTMDQEHNDKSQNYLVHFEDHYLMLINKDKVSAKNGSDVLTIFPELKAAIDMSLVLWPRKYVIPCRTDPDQPHTWFCTFLRTIINPLTGKCMNQGVNLLRSSYITHHHALPGVDVNVKKRLAKYMRHSWQMAETNYRKI